MVEALGSEMTLGDYWTLYSGSDWACEERGSGLWVPACLLGIKKGNVWISKRETFFYFLMAVLLPEAQTETPLGGASSQSKNGTFLEAHSER